MPGTSVVICGYTTDRWSWLCSAVRSVLAQEPPPDEVLVVVDHSPSLERLALAAFVALGVTVLANLDRRGLSGSRNTGLRRAAGDVVLFLDDDAEAEPGWLAAHLGHYTDDEVLGVGGLVEPAWDVGPPRWFPPEFGWAVGCSYVGQPTTTAAVRNPIGANMSFRRRVLEEAGGFTEALGRVGASGSGCEETEVAIRVRQLVPGGTILHDPSAVVRHHVPASRATPRYFVRRCWAEGWSKARLQRLVGPAQALSAERSYVRTVLPRAVREDMTEAVTGRDPAGLGRAAVVVLGLASTGLGFAAGRLHPHRGGESLRARRGTGRPHQMVGGAT